VEPFSFFSQGFLYTSKFKKIGMISPIFAKKANLKQCASNYVSIGIVSRVAILGDLMRVKNILIIGFLVSLICPPTATAITWQEQMLKSINSIRAEKSLTPLKMCRPLVKAAQNYAKNMASQDFLDHTGKDGSTPGSRIQKAGYDWKNSRKGSMIAENIAAGQNSVLEVMRDWRKSKSHYKNMVTPEFTHVGFGMAINPNSEYRKFWVQNLGFGASC
jgi:uncharacterized protein YkwD